MTLPFIQVLVALKAELVNAVLPVVIGGKSVTVRHHRYRESNLDELPALAIRFVSNDVSALGRETTDSGMPEQVWELSVDLVSDVDLAPEADEAGAADPDPTGYAGPAAISKAVLNWLFPGDDVPIDLGGLAWDLRYEGTAPDEDVSSPDYARMVERLVVLYRVRADQPTIILTGN